MTFDPDSIMTIVAAIIGSGIITTLIIKYAERRKTAAEANLSDAKATDVLVKAGETAVGILQAQLERALARIDKLEQQADEKDERIRLLEEEVGYLRAHVARLESEG